MLDDLAVRAPEEHRPDDWPSNGKVLSGQLRAAQEELHEAGIALRFRKIGGGRRLITITRVEADQPLSSAVEAEMHSDIVAHLYILASPARLWSALTDGNLLRQATGFSKAAGTSVS